VALLFTLKSILKGKRRIMEKLKIFHHAKIYIIFKKTQAKISCLKNPHIKIKIDLLLLPWVGQNPLSYYYTHYNEFKHNILAYLGRQDPTKA
jgi:hypothetical protein